MADDAKHKREPTLNWFLWWQIDPQELSRQVEQYATLPFHKAARGLAVICVLISAAITGIFIAVGTTPLLGGLDAIAMLALGLFIYLGHRWASVAAMILWTFEKGSLLLGGFADGGNPVTQIIWWCLFMHAFYLAFRVEQQRRKPNPDAASYFT